MWEVEALTTDELEAELIRLESIKSQVAALQTELIREADKRQLPTWDGCRTLAEWVAGRLDLSSESARTHADLSRRLADLPELSKRLASGSIGWERTAALAAIATVDHDLDLIERTRGLDLNGVRRFAARHRRTTRQQERRHHDESYLVVQPSLDESWWQLRGGLSGPAGALVEQALNERADQFTPDDSSPAHRRALALESMCADAADSPLPDGGTRRSPTIAAFVDLDHASGAETGVEIAAGPPLGPAALEELWCEGSVQFVGIRNGQPVLATKATRTIPPAVRRFVLWRDKCCRAPGCDSRHRLQPHHIRPRSHTGTHHPDNLVTLCWYHHHVVVHRRQMVIEAQADGSIRFVTPADCRSPP